MVKCITLKSYVAFLLLVCCCIASVPRRDPRDDFYNHVVVQPVVYRSFSVHKNPLSFQGYAEEIKLQFEAFGKNFEVDLKKNEHLFAPNYREILDSGEKREIHNFSNESERRCYYRGQLPNAKNSFAAISTCDGISGMIFDGKETYYIEPDHLSENVKHFLFKATDFKHTGFKCEVENDLFPMNDKKLSQMKVQHLEDPYLQISDYDNRYIELVVVCDNSMFRNYKNDSVAVVDRVKQIINFANVLLSEFGIFLILKTIWIWDKKDYIDVTSDPTSTLNNFLKFRQDSLLLGDPNDNALFLTNQTYDRDVVGNTYLSGICSKEQSGENVSDFPGSASIAGTITAHELGHNLGAGHDNNVKDSKCEDGYCIMNCYLRFPLPVHWSLYSEYGIRTTYWSGTDSCLKNEPPVLNGPSCGNGYLEAGEQCDCGIKQFCDDICCDAKTCRKTC